MEMHNLESTVDVHSTLFSRIEVQIFGLLSPDIELVFGVVPRNFIGNHDSKVEFGSEISLCISNTPTSK